MTARAWCFTLADAVRENGRSFPGRVALVSGDLRLTHDQLDRRSDRLAAWLLARGLEPGERVAWIGRSSHAVVELLFAAAKCGAVLVPVNWRLAPDELPALLAAARPRVVVADEGDDVAALRAAARAAAPAASAVGARDVEQAAAGDAGDDPALDASDALPVLGIGLVAPDGRTRVALISQRAVVAQNVALVAAGIVRPTGERHLASGPLFHVGGLLPLLSTLHAGGLAVIAPDAEPERLCELLARERCTSAYLMTPTIERIVALGRDGRPDLSALRFAMGRPTDASRAAWHAMTACGETATPGMVGYGQTQTFGMVTQEARAPGCAGNVGVASPLAAVRVVDPDGRECAPGEVGELAVRGPLLMSGYLDADAGDGAAPHAAPDAELRAPAGLGGAWRLTGDLGVREPDGSIGFVGPLTDVIKTGMENVHPVEVERALRAHPAVADACVIGVPDPVWGARVHAVLEGGDGAPGTAELRRFLAGRLAAYKHPRGVDVVAALPRAAAGGVDRDAVRRIHGSTAEE